MKTSLSLLAVSAAVLVSGSALAQTSLAEVRPRYETNERWASSVLTGRTVGAGRFVVHPEIGYPGVSVGFLWGQTSTFDAGFRLSAGYGTRYGFGVVPTAGAQAILRWNFINTGIVSLGGRMEPGAFIAPWNTGNVALLAPFGLDFGIHPHPIVAIAIGGSIGVGAVIDYAGRAAYIMPFEIGPGVEVNITDGLALTVNTRFVSGWSAPYAPYLGDYAGYGARASIGLAFKN